jgi:predicted signal transduction protein with EAL and GGDEF domain
VPEFAVVKDAVQRAWLDAQRQAAADAAYEKLRAHYTVVRQDQTETPKK